MIPDKIKLEILTPERKVYDGEIAAVRLPGNGGYFGVYPGHTPFVATLQIGEIKIEVTEGREDYYATSGGVAEVLPGKVAVLTETCESATKIDVKRAEAARERAEKRLHEGRKSWDLQRAQIALTRAINRINVSSK